MQFADIKDCSFVDMISYEILELDDLNKECVMFGAGKMGAELYEMIIEQYDVIAYSDNNSKVWGTSLHDVPIVSPNELRSLTQKGTVDVIVSSFYAVEKMVSQLKEMNLNARILTMELLEYVGSDENSLIIDVEKVVTKSKPIYLQGKRDNKIKIIFMLYSLTSFSSYESIYEQMLHDERFEPVLVLAPKRKTIESKKVIYDYELMLEETMVKRGYSFLWAYKDSQWIDIYALNPDGIFYQTPYSKVQLPAICRESHYCDDIKIMNTPYGVLMGEDINSLLSDATLVLNFVQNSWKVFLDKSNYDVFVKEPSFLDKIVLSGTPKVDFYLTGVRNKDLYYKNTNSTKILYTPTWMAAKGRSSFLHYHDYFAELIQDKQVELVLRLHPLLIAEIETLNLLPKNELDSILSVFKNSENCVFDLYGDYRSAILDSDFAVMDITSLVYEYLPTGKPLILTAPNINEFSIKPSVKELCYVAENREQMIGYIEMLMNGDDPLCEKRLSVVGDKSGLFPNGIANGKFIVDYIAKHIREN